MHARIDAQGQATEQGGLGTTEDTIDSIASSAQPVSAGGSKDSDSKPTSHRTQPAAANDAEAQYWQALNAPDPRYATGTNDAMASTGKAERFASVYYFHTDQVGMPEELSNHEGQLCWQASYKTWGSAVTESWEVKELAGGKVHRLDEGEAPKGEGACSDGAICGSP